VFCHGAVSVYCCINIVVAQIWSGKNRKFFHFIDLFKVPFDSINEKRPQLTQRIISVRSHKALASFEPRSRELHVAITTIFDERGERNQRIGDVSSFGSVSPFCATAIADLEISEFKSDPSCHAKEIAGWK